jgi:hypothetical protein
LANLALGQSEPNGGLVMTSSLLERPVSTRPFPEEHSSAEHLLPEHFSANLVVDRTDIKFHNIALGRVRISVNITNCGETSSQSMPLLLQAAPLGAFLPWTNLTALLVPPIEPGKSIEVATEVTTSLTKPLGEFSRIPPSKLLIAIGNGDEPNPRIQQQSDSQLQRQTATSLRDFFALLFRKNSKDLLQPTLPDDPMDLLMRPNVHWAGNINVLIGRQAVERHLAQALRVYAGHTNLAVFFVGDRSDEYQFDLTGSGAAWNAKLFDCTGLPSLLSATTCAKPIQPSKWTWLDSRHLILLALSPSANCAAGTVNIHVRQRSTNRDAVVEFSLDPTAAGPGCYTI